MGLNNLSRRLFIILFILFILFTPSLQEGSSAQEKEVEPTGLGQAPEIDPSWLIKRDQETRGNQAAESEYFSFLPLAVDPSKPVPLTNCGVNNQEKKLATLAKTHPGQERPEMRCNNILSEVAHERAMDMGQNGYFSHVNLDGYGPNFLVEQAGYELPEWWSDSPTLNYIESIAAGYATADEAWNAWIKSNSHRTHVLGENDFWAEQTNYGMGYIYIEGSPFGHYWVFITAPPEGN